MCGLCSLIPVEDQFVVLASPKSLKHPCYPPWLTTWRVELCVQKLIHSSDFYYIMMTQSLESPRHNIIQCDWYGVGNYSSSRHLNFVDLNRIYQTAEL